MVYKKLKIYLFHFFLRRLKLTFTYRLITYNMNSVKIYLKELQQTIKNCFCFKRDTSAAKEINSPMSLLIAFSHSISLVKNNLEAQNFLKQNESKIRPSIIFGIYFSCFVLLNVNVNSAFFSTNFMRYILKDEYLQVQSDSKWMMQKENNVKLLLWL